MSLTEYAAADMEWWHRLAAAWSAWQDGRAATQAVRDWQRQTIAERRGMG